MARWRFACRLGWSRPGRRLKCANCQPIKVVVQVRVPLGNTTSIPKLLEMWNALGRYVHEQNLEPDWDNDLTTHMNPRHEDSDDADHLLAGPPLSRRGVGRRPASCIQRGAHPGRVRAHTLPPPRAVHQVSSGGVPLTREPPVPP